MILFRCFAWDFRSAPDRPDGPLWFARPFQGDGRHDNPHEYGCLYVGAIPISGVVEQLSRFRGEALVPDMLVRRGLPLALAELELLDHERVMDLDDPRVLDENRLRPSVVATHHRDVTQPQALDLYRRHPDLTGLRWWSTFEALWANVTLFDRAASALDVRTCRELAVDDNVVVEAAELLGL